MTETADETSLGFEGERIILLLGGYIRELPTLKIPASIHETIRLYSWEIPAHSMQCIAATHLLATKINDYMKSAERVCPFSGNHDLNILDYIYVRGGALRDSYLLRKMSDIDLVVNIHELCKQYERHLVTYHSKKGEQQAADCQCLFWQHYLNKHRSLSENNLHSKLKKTWFTNQRKKEKKKGSSRSYTTNNEQVDKILDFENYVVNCDYLLNARFVMNILYHSELRPQLKITCKYFGHHWLCVLKSSEYHGMKVRNISFDICDQVGNTYGRYETFRQYQQWNSGGGGDAKINISQTVSDIDKYKKQKKSASNQEEEEEKEIIAISVPIFPFAMDVVYYGFTINAMHISLASVLKPSRMSGGIDFNWESKLSKEYNNAVVNKYNAIALRDLRGKLLQCPSLQVINAVTADFYFWRLVKTAQKFIDFIERGVWRIDDVYLQHTMAHYAQWLDDEFISRDGKIFQSKFIHKFVVWGISTDNADSYKRDVVNRFRVMKRIHFEPFFIEVLDKYPVKVKQKLEQEVRRNGSRCRQTFKHCFAQFGYPDMPNI
eukprot:CAMPEP_0197022172 /NCGR_PEP_ID=MMETSP1384-20130603/3067_1 /TAXON_ID=29189 /ORGANISM="Ammonia sp." /LENGTH=547 /DNA_ID=CAMNT_0042450153 /DNA_START=33 /DNA_END=1676 /DNA_ORIENTATION=+